MDFSNIIPTLQDQDSLSFLILLLSVFYFVLYFKYKHTSNLIAAVISLVFVLLNATIFQAKMNSGELFPIEVMLWLPLSILILAIVSIYSLIKTFKGEPKKIFFIISTFLAIYLLYYIIFLSSVNY